MSDALLTFEIASHLQDTVRAYNRGLAVDALGKSVLGVIFSFFTFGFVYACGWFAGLLFGRSLGLQPWQFAALASGLFFVVACWSAWQHVDPMAGLPPRLSDEQEALHTLVSHAALGNGYFNPRHAVAGFAVVLMGGPANILEALGIWLSRIRDNQSVIEEASCLLADCRADYPIEKVRVPAAVFLLKRLTLVKVVPCGDSSAFALTAKGSAILSKAEGRARKKPAGSQPSAKKQR